MYGTGPDSTSVGGDEATVFGHARDRFLQNLSSEDREAFVRINSSTELLNDFKRLQEFVKNDSRWMKVFSAVKNCSDQLQPYFDIIGIVTQSNPEWAAVAWGAFRLVLQLASNFVGFFEKLADVLSQVASLIPAYSDVLQFDISHPSIRFRMSLDKFYEDLFEFFQAVTRLFTRKSGKLKRTPVVIGQLLWQPFGVRFKKFLEQLGFHQRVLRLELDVLQFTATQSFSQIWTQEKTVNTTFQAEARQYFKLVEEMRQRFTGEKREKLVEAIRVWISPPRYAESYERAIAAREQGTSKWLFDVNAFKTWKHTWNDAPNGSDLKGVLWVAGNPGTGKTILASSCVQELRFPPHNPSQASPSVVYFFFEAEIPGTYETILDFFAVSMSSERREGQMTSTYNEMIDLLVSLIKYLGRFYLVLDGVDECDEPDDMLLDLWKLRNIQGLRIVLFSRPNVGFLRRTLKAEQWIYLTPASHAMDLEIYFRRNLERLQDLRLLPSTVVMKELIINLQFGANGMFLWARLMMNYLRSPAFSSSRRISIILNLETPEGLDDMYARIFRQLSGGLRHEQALVRNILLWLTFGESPLSCSQLNDVLLNEGDALRQTISRNYSDDIKEFENAVIVTCGGLVEFRHTSCHYIHYTALEYFRSHCSAPEACVGAHAGSVEYFFPPNFDAHTELATRIRIVCYLDNMVIKDRRSQIEPQTSQEELRKVSIGWTVQFEIYNTNLQEPELNGEWKFDLEADEVIRQIQFFSKIVALNQVEPGDHVSQQDLAIHFPTSIGNNLDVFTVLRGVYIHKCLEKASSSVPYKSTDSWIILPIPVQHYERSTQLHYSSLLNSRGEALEAGPPVSWAASVKIDDLTAFRLAAHNDYLLYYAIRGTSVTRRSGGGAENDCNGTDPFTRVSTAYRNDHGSGSVHKNIPRNVRYQNGICVAERCEDQYSHNTEHYNIDNNHQSREDEDDLKTIPSPGHDDEHCDDDEDAAEEMSISGHSDSVPENECMATSIAVFSMAGTRQGEAIHLLDYLENTGEDKYIGKYAFHPTLPLLAIHCGSECSGRIVLWNIRSSECSKHVSETITRFQTLVEETVHWTESLQFSACGEQVIIEEYLAEQPTVIPIGESVLYRMAQEMQDLPAATHSRSAAGESQAMSLAHTMTLPQNEIMLLDPKSSTRLDFHPNPVHTDIELVKSDGSFQTVQPLLTLPNRSDIQHINITLLPPRDIHTKRMRIMMTKSPKLFCSLADADEDTPTAIVEKDTRALFHARKRRCGPEFLRSWEIVAPVVSNGSSTFQSANMTGEERKRLQPSESHGNSVQNGRAFADSGRAQVLGT
ncbi:hypothetical protein MMC17_003912 [Xylographa soralifera]|nr:hypothetical protein [Xylographa soralifera]